MYDERLGTDWTEISADEAIDRAFALGVAAAFGYENRAEFDRLLGALDTAYDRSIIDLAYEEGRQEADGLSGDTSEREVWDSLVGAADANAGRRRSPPGPTDGPGPAGERPSMLDRLDLLEGGADLGALRRPAFLATDRDGDE